MSYLGKYERAVHIAKELSENKPGHFQSMDKPWGMCGGPIPQHAYEALLSFLDTLYKRGLDMPWLTAYPIDATRGGIWMEWQRDSINTTADWEPDYEDPNMCYFHSLNTKTSGENGGVLVPWSELPDRIERIYGLAKDAPFVFKRV